MAFSLPGSTFLKPEMPGYSARAVLAAGSGLQPQAAQSQATWAPAQRPLLRALTPAWALEPAGWNCDLELQRPYIHRIYI